MKLTYRGRELKQKFVPDLIRYGKIILEINAVSHLTNEHRVQVINYLNATDYQLRILVNFGSHPKLEWERLVHTPKKRRQKNRQKVLARE